MPAFSKYANAAAGLYSFGVTSWIAVIRSTPAEWLEALSACLFSFTARISGSIKNDGLFVSSRAVRTSIALPFGIQPGAIVQVGKGNGGAVEPLGLKPKPV